MLLFVHMHKCAGSSTVRKAVKSGFRLPLGHRNGNLVLNDTQVKYAQLDKSSFQELMRQQRAEGVNFLAMEWDFPPMDWFDTLEAEIFTVLRDPLDRAVSNFRFAKVSGRIKAGTRFRRFIDASNEAQKPLSRTANYFVRKLSASPSSQVLGPEHLETAVEALGRFRAVITLGRDDLNARLGELGLAAEAKPAKSATEMASSLPPERLAVSAEDKAWFVEKNALDYELMRRLEAGLATTVSPIIAAG